MKLFFFRTSLARPILLRSGSAKDDQRIRRSQGVLFPDLFSAHGAPSVNSFGQGDNNPLCDTLPEGFRSKRSTGRDEIGKPARRRQRCADDAKTA